MDLHQVAKCARVLGHQYIRPGQHVERAQGDVPSRADWCRDEVQARRNGAQCGPMAGLGRISRVPHKFTSLSEPSTLAADRRCAAK
jgi:hypothetical protein